MSKAWKITTIILSSILGAILIFLSVYYLWPWNKDFFDNATAEFKIPGLDTKFTPQGMSKIDGSDKYLISGYMSDGSASRFYVINNGAVEKYFTLSQDETAYTGHAGGVLSHGGTIWVVGDKNCHRFFLSHVTDVDNGGVVNIVDSFETSNGADFVFEHDNYLFIGEFYKKDKYETDASHHLKTSSGETNPSLVYGYLINESMSYGLDGTMPTKILSIRGECQGIDVYGDRIVMSCSYSIKDSTMLCYNNVLNLEKHGTFILGKSYIDLWYLDANSLVSEKQIPSMSEEIVIDNNRVYILFESGAKKYKIFNRKQLDCVYSVDLSYFNK